MFFAFFASQLMFEISLSSERFYTQDLFFIIVSEAKLESFMFTLVLRSSSSSFAQTPTHIHTPSNSHTVHVTVIYIAYISLFDECFHFELEIN